MSDTILSLVEVRFRGQDLTQRASPFVRHSAQGSCGRQCTGDSSEVKCLYKANFLSGGNFSSKVALEVCLSGKFVKW